MDQLSHHRTKCSRWIDGTFLGKFIDRLILRDHFSGWIRFPLYEANSHS